MLPTVGDQAMGAVEPSPVRHWHAGVAKDHRTTAAKAYRLLRQAINAALADEIIARNPCRVKGGGQESSGERPVASIAEVQALADAMPRALADRRSPGGVVPASAGRTVGAPATRRRPVEWAPHRLEDADHDQRDEAQS